MTSMDQLADFVNSLLPKSNAEIDSKLDNCVMCGKFVPSDFYNGGHCPKCIELLDAEQQEDEIGIGTGSICYIDENTCRHCIKKWPMLETVYNAVYGDRK